MKHPEVCPDVREFKDWRSQLYNALGSRRDSVMELLDSLSSNLQASTVAELSLNPLFRRDYNSLYKGIQEFLPSQQSENRDQVVSELLRVVSSTIPAPRTRGFYLFGVDATPHPRPYSPTLEDKTYIYQPNAIKGNKPINIGHSYSVISALLEPEETGDSPWTIPLLGERIPSGEKSSSLALKQVKKIFNNSSTPWSDKLSVLVADTLYSKRGFLAEQVKQENLVTVTRIRSNRVFYRQFIPEASQGKISGHPRWYGDKFDLKDLRTWHDPDEIFQSTFITKRGGELNLKISGWKQMLMRGTKDYGMHNYPFTLRQIVVSDGRGSAVWKPMWLIVIGSRRHQLGLLECYQAYRQRYDLEHLFRFGKQKLLMNAYSTPEIEHEENWFQLALLAYVNLWKARKVAKVLPRPWEHYLTQNESTKITASLVQRDFYRIIATIGTPAKSPKRRGYSPGGIKGELKVPRIRHQVIKKHPKRKKKKRKVS